VTLSEPNEVLGPVDLSMLIIATLLRFYAP